MKVFSFLSNPNFPIRVLGRKNRDVDRFNQFITLVVKFTIGAFLAIKSQCIHSRNAS